MRAFAAFWKKEWMESIRSGKIGILLLLFFLFGVMNPAIAKLTPWMMEQMADSLAGAGIVFVEISVDASISWMQFFKNIPMGLIAFLLLYGSLFTKEYSKGTLVLPLTKGLKRYQMVLAKSTLLLLVWTVCYLLCFFVTYGYNAYFWENDIVKNLFFAGSAWWLFGIWTISLSVFFASVFRSSGGILLGMGASVFLSYLAGMIPKIKEYTPTMLMKVSALLSEDGGVEAYRKAIVVTVVLSVVCIGTSIPIMEKKRID